jgi:MATE family multidrug resistance protein
MATLLEPLASIVDNALAGNKDTDLFAAVAIGASIVTSFAWVFNFLTHVPTQRISKSFAKDDRNGVEANFHTALLIALALGLFCSVILFSTQDWLLELTNTPADLFETAKEYFSVRLIAVPLFLVFTVLLSLLRGIKKVGFVFVLLLIVTSLNILLSYLFLYQFDYGAQGIAAGTVIAHTIGILIAIFRIQFIEKFSVFPRPKNIDLATFKSLGSDGFNMFGRTFVLTASFYLLTRTAAGMGTKNLAAYQLGLQGWLFSSFFIDGFAMSGTILTAEHYEKKEWATLKELEQKLRNLCLALGAIICFGLLLFEKQFFNFFSNDTEVFAILDQSWWIVCVAQIPLSYSYLLDGHLFGLGGYAYLRKHMMIGFCLSILPLLIFSKLAELEIQHLWFGLFALGMYRFISGLYHWKNIVNFERGKSFG